jgi:hypothetical protein
MRTPATAVAIWALMLTGMVVGSGCNKQPSTRYNSIEIHGKPQFQAQVTNALELLRTKAPDAYEVVAREIGDIRESAHSGMRAWQNPPVFEMADPTAFFSVTWCAGSIAHDSWHSKLYHDYLRNNSNSSRVPDEVWTGESAEKKCVAHQARVMKAIGATHEEIDWLQTTNDFWNVKYRDRNW